MGAPAARVSELSRLWADAGIEVEVLTGFPNHPTGVVPLEYRAKLHRLIQREDYFGVTVQRTWLWPLPNRKSIERILNYSSFCFSAAFRGLFLRRPDVVIGSSPQLLVGISAWFVARMKRVPFIFEVRDLWPESLIAVGVRPQGSLLNRILGWIAGFLYRSADHIVVVSPAFIPTLVNDWKVPQEKISTVVNGVETDLFDSNGGDGGWRARLDLEQKFVVAYIGTIGNAAGMGTLLDAAAILASSAPHVSFLVVGEGAEREQITKEAGRRNLQNVIFVRQQPRQQVANLIRTADVCLVLLLKAEVFRTVIPTKMLEFMSCGRPVLVAVDGQAREIVERANGGLYVEPEDARELAAGILQLARSPESCLAMGASARRHILQHFDRTATAQLYAKLLNHMLSALEKDGCISR